MKNLKWNKTYISFGVAIVCVLTFAVFLLRAGHILSGDYALYICQAKSLLSGTQQTVFTDMEEMIKLSTYQLYSPTLYPWGFPVLLALLIAVFGVNYLVFKVFLFVCIIFTLYLIWADNRKTEEMSKGIWVVLLLALNVNLLYATERVLSDLPYLCFLSFSLFLIHRYRPFGEFLKKKIWFALGLGFILFFTTLLRTEGFLLLPALFAHQIAEFIAYRKQKPKTKAPFITVAWWVALPYLVLFTLTLLTQPIFLSGFLAHSNHFEKLSFSLLVSHFLYYLEEGPSQCLMIFKNVGLGGSLVFWLIVLWGAICSGHKKIADVTYLLCTIGLLIVWPHQTIRYFIPILPIVLYFFVQGTNVFPENGKMARYNISGIILGCCLCVQFFFFVLLLLNYDKKYDDKKMNVESPNATAMFDYLRTHTRSGDVVGCAESRTIYLYTGRLSCNLSASPDDTAYKADWYVEFRNRGGYLQHEPYVLETNPDLFREVFRNHDFIIYKIQKP